MTLDAAGIALVLATVAVGVFVKGITGMGVPIIAVPVLAALTTVEDAVVVIAAPTVLSNGWLVWTYRANGAGLRPLLAPLIAAGVVGAVVGTWLLVSLDDRVMSLVLAVFILVYVAWALIDREGSLPEGLARRLAGPTGLVAGTLHGATGISGPVVAAYFHSMRLPRTAFIVAVTTPFFLFGLVQLGAMAGLGVYTEERLLASLAACLPVVLILPVAMRVGDRVSSRVFELAVLSVLLVAGVRLLLSAL